jgi:rubrerythrin
VARTRYTFFASKAKKEGHEQISEIFLETVENEKEHAKRFYKLINSEGNAVHVQLDVVVHPIATAELNLKATAGDELEVDSQMCPNWAAVVEQEAFDGIATIFRAIASVEREDEDLRVALSQHVI